MRDAKTFSAIACGLALAAAGLCAHVWAAESGEVLVVEQDYNLTTPAKQDGKNVRQRLFVAKDWMRIEEYAAQGAAPTETTIIDMQTEKIVTLFQDHGTDQTISDFKRTVTFEQRRERIEKTRANLMKDADKLPEGSERDIWLQMNHVLMDEKRKFELQGNKKTSETKDLLGVQAEKAAVGDGRDKKYTALTAYLHPDVVMPADSAEVLYLLQLIGPKLKEFLDLNKALFRRLPLEMELDVVGGGLLKTKVTKVSWMREADTAKLRAIPNVPEKDNRTRASQAQELTTEKREGVKPPAAPNAIKPDPSQ